MNPTSPQEYQPLINFTGTGKRLFVIYLQNLILTIISLGVYGFWGKVRVRRYIWENTHILGTLLEYTGTGWELLRSFIVVMLLVVLGMVTFHALNTLHLVGSYALLLVFLYTATHFAIYQAMRYRFTRTFWRGIRGNISGSVLKYSIVGIGLNILSLISLGLLSPMAKARLTRRIAKNMFFGSRQFCFKNRMLELYISWFLCCIGFIALSILLCTVSCLVVPKFIGTPLDEFNFTSPAKPEIILISVIYASMFISYIICHIPYDAAYIRWFCRGLSYGQLKFSASKLSGLNYMGLKFTNLLLFIFSLGLASPWITVRTCRFIFSCVNYTGELQPETILRDEQPDKAFGEGVLDAMDISIGFY